MRPALMLLSVSLSIFSVIAGCSPTSGPEELLEDVQPGGNNPGEDEENRNDMEQFSHLTLDNTIADVADNPAFKGFGQYILPLEWRYDPDMKLRNIPSLLPYHNYVDAGRAVGYINEMIDMVNRGDKLFYSLGRKDTGQALKDGPTAPLNSGKSISPLPRKTTGNKQTRISSENN